MSAECIGMAADYGWAWVARREMEIRSRRPPWYEDTHYQGLGLPLLLLGLPLVLGILFRPTLTSGWFVVWLVPYACYVTYASANLAAGAVGADLVRLQRLPVSAWSLLWGKLLGSAVHIWGELVFMAVPIGVLSWMLTGSLMPGICVVAWIFGLSAWFATLGFWQSATGSGPKDAARWTRTCIDLLVVGFPFVILLLHGVDFLDRDFLRGLWLLHPMGGLALVHPEAGGAALAYGCSVALLSGALLIVGAFFRLRRLLP